MAILPIANHEFAAMLQRARPPVGWSETLAVANSGGPDSTCLLFLLSRCITEAWNEHGVTPARKLPRRIVSLSVNHDLQSSSTTMAEHAAKVADQLGVKHVTTKLPWGQATYPPKPGPGDKIEELARDMRQMVLFNEMRRVGANALASGHHVDDQVETMFMRVGRGSSQNGLAGMRVCRRWGMGTGGESLGKLFEVDGMRTWMVRPLLEVTKDKILATCDHHNLEYVTDPTNFQPQLTIRNCIRHILKEGGMSKNITPDPELPDGLTRQLIDINSACADNIVPGLHLGTNAPRLREINKEMTTLRDGTDLAVDDIIKRSRLSSPPGTFLISSQDLKAINSPNVREALLYRITRYVSPEPWGSPRAELGRRKISLQRLQTQLMDTSISTKNNSLCVGSGVWWRPVRIERRKLRTNVASANASGLFWLALRQPPHRNYDPETRDNQPNGLHLNITQTITESITAWRSDSKIGKVEIPFDRRFLVTIHLDRMQDSLDPSLAQVQIIVEATSPWTLPKVTQFDGVDSKTIHSYISDWPEAHGRDHPSVRWEIPKPVKSDWIDINPFRPLSSI